MNKILILFVLTIILAGTISAFNWSNSVVSYWGLNETSGNVIDAKGLNNGTTNSTRNVVGKLNNSYNFAGTEQIVTFSDSSSLEPSNFSVSAWVWQNSSGNQVIIDKSGGNAEGYMIRTNSNLQCNINKGGTGSGASANQSTNFQTGSWQFVVCTFDGSTIRLYVNGTSVSNTSYSTPITYNARNVSLGRETNTSIGSWIGYIDEVGFWNKSLNLSEIQELYNNGDGLAYSLTEGIWLINESYNTEVTEGGNSTFIGNFTTNGTTLTAVRLVYNGTEYSGTIVQSGDVYVVTRTITIPLVSSNSNLSFYWNATLSNGYSKNFSSKNQSVLNYGADDCSSLTAVLYNFTIYDEISQIILNGATQNTTAKLDLQLYSLDRTTLITNFSKLYNETNSFSVCLTDNLSSGSTYSADLQLQYDADSYASEFYHIQNSTISTVDFPTNISLYDLLDSSSQAFKITYKDDSFLPVRDALVQIQRRYINEGLFKTIEIPKTDFNGETLAHLQLNDVVYTFIIVKNGETLATFDNVIAQCPNPSIVDCKINFNSFSSSLSPTDFTTLEDFAYTLSYNRDTRIVTTIFTIPSSTIATVKLNVTLYDQLGNTTACTDTLTTSSGTLQCTVPQNLGNGTAIATITKNNVVIGQGFISLAQNPSDIFGSSLVFLTLFLYLTLIGVGVSESPAITGFFLILGIILGVALNLVTSFGWVGSGATILWIIIAVILIMIKGGNR